MFHVEHIHVSKLCDFPIIVRVQNYTFAADEASRKMFLELGFDTAFIRLGMALEINSCFAFHFFRYMYHDEEYMQPQITWQVSSCLAFGS